MRRSLIQSAVMILFTVILNSSAYSANEYFRSIASGNWNLSSTWEMSTNAGNSWNPTSSVPGDTSGLVTVRSPNTVTLTASAVTNELTVNTGAAISINNGFTLTITDGAGVDLLLAAGGIISGSGSVRSQGAGTSFVIRNGSTFNVPFNVNSGTATAYDDASPLTAVFRAAITIDSGAAMTSLPGGYSFQANANVINNGAISGNSIFKMRGSSFVNNGTVSITDFNLDSTTTITATNPVTGTNISINSTGNVSFSGNVTFSPTGFFNINTGGILNPAGLTVNSGTLKLFSGGTIANTGTFKTAGTPVLIIRAGSNFNAPLNVFSGTTTAYDDSSPLTAIFKGTITVNAGATITSPSGGYSFQANGNVINNGSISGATIFRMRGASFTNNGTVSIQDFNLDSTTLITATTPFTGANININSSGNVSFSGNVTFSPSSNFNINSGGILNPGGLTLSSGTMFLNSGGTIANTGTFKTSGTPVLVVRSGSNFNAQLNVVSGATTAYDNSGTLTAIFKGAITINAGATLTSQSGGYSFQANSNVTNNGTITGATIFRMRGSSFVNNGAMTIQEFNLDSTTTISGTTPFTGTNITVSGTGNVSISGNVTFSPTGFFNINTGGILNPAGLTFNSGTMRLYSGGTVANTGALKTSASPVLIIKLGSNFNGQLNVVSGTTTAYDDGGSITAVFKGTVTIDTGASLSGIAGGYSIQAEGDVINNGSVSGNSIFRFAGPVFTNNGIVSVTTFNFNTGAHTLQGTGSWSSDANILSGSVTTLGSNHMMKKININSGGTFGLSTYRLSLTADNPIVNNGTFANTNGAVEYNGNVQQGISTTNITYSRLRINNVNGTYLPAAVTVNDTLSVITGYLNLNGFILTISPTGYLTETGGNTVQGTAGYITTTRTLNAPSALNVGGLGAVITTPINLGSTEIRRGHTIQNGLNGNTSIKRYFDILPANNNALNATLVFKYDESELNGKTEGALTLFRSTNSGSTWTSNGGTVNTVTNSITLTGISQFSRWSASSVASLAAQIKVIMEGFYDIATNRLNMRDTVRAYLRNITSPYAVVDSALSVIDSTIFTGNFNFVNALSGTYYIQIKHRNSLETWSKSGGQPYTLGTAMSYDFTTGAAQAYGNNMALKGAKYTIYSGDVTQNGFVDLQDVILINNAASGFLTGYVVTDVNGNSIVDLTDVLIAYNNSNNFVAKIIP